MLDDIYNTKILELAGNIERIGRLDAPDASARKHSKLCGSSVVVDLCASEVDGEYVVTDFAHEVKACALGQASSSIMAQRVVGANFKKIRELQQLMHVMLKDNGPPPTGRFEDCRYLEPVREFKARHTSTLLTFDAVVECIDHIEYGDKQDGVVVAGQVDQLVAR